MTNTALKLVAFDIPDLAVISAHLEGAQLRPPNIAWLRDEKRFALLIHRKMRERDAAQRCPTGLHFERVLKVTHQHFDRGRDTPYTLLSMLFEAGDSPGGAVMLVFTDGSVIRLEVECLEAAMCDLPCENPAG